MADNFSILGQLAPSDENETVLYTVPSASATTVGSVAVAPKVVSRITQTVVSSLIVCNLNAASAEYYVRLKASGATDNNKEWIFYDTSIPGKRTHVLSLALTLGSGDSLKVKVGTGDSNKLAFTAMGIEVT